MKKQFEGFKPPNTTPVPDIVFDELLRTLTGNELKVLLYIIRRTYGFGKNADAISLSQFRKGITTQEKKVLDYGCGIEHNRTILVALASLEKKGYVRSKKRHTNAGDADATIYTLRFQEACQAQGNEGVVTSSNDVVTSSNDVVTSSNDGSYLESLRWLPQVTTVVTSGNQQETVLQDTDSQETVIQEGSESYVSLHTRPIDLTEKREERKTNPALPVLVLSVSDSQPAMRKEEQEEEDVSLVETQRRIPIVKPAQQTNSVSPVLPPLSLTEQVSSAPVAPAPQVGEQRGAGKGKRVPKPVLPDINPEVLAVIERWEQAMKKTYPRTDALLRAATLLAPCHPTVEDLKAVRGFCFTSNPRWFRDERKGAVTLLDIAKNWEAWQSSQEQAPKPQATPGKIGDYYIFSEAM